VLTAVDMGGGVLLGGCDRDDGRIWRLQPELRRHQGEWAPSAASADSADSVLEPYIS
jgi:hypothetical protein